ncbi:MAG: flagellar filament capping protein FliD, partial [Pirellulaceae bacterium]|nr:flagellar filament capping protein FliD [Pirellulaceae bacterium]
TPKIFLENQIWSTTGELGLANVLSSRFFSGGSTLSLQQLGVRIGDDGTLSFDKTKFDERYAADSNAVEKFFTQEGTGLAARSNTVSEQLAGATNSVLINRSQALQQSIESNSERISALTAALAREEESLTLEFFRLEEAIARLQANSTSIASIQPITRLFNQ